MLRFRRDDGSDYSDWGKCRLGSLLSFKNGLNIGKEKFGSGIKFISVLDILNNNYIDYNNIRGMVDIDQTLLNEFDVEYGDILFQRSSETRIDAGKSNVYLDKEKKATFGGFVIRGKKIGDYIPEFMNFCLGSAGVRKQIIRKAQGEQHVNVGQDILSNIEITLPCMEEQQKIADFLSEVDNIIAESEREIESLESQKKGAMQKIFSQEVRFKADDGSEYPEWKNMQINELGNIVTGTTPSTQNSEFYGNEYLWVTPSDISDKKEINYTERKLSKLGLNKGRIVPKNSVLVTCIASIGKNCILREKGSCNQQINAITPSENNNVDFIYYLICAINNKMLSLAGQTATPILNKSVFGKIKIKVPYLEEQQKIADFLSELDNAIEYAKEELEVWKNIKKGLLQQMFE